MRKTSRKAQVVLWANVLGCVLRMIFATLDCFADSGITNWKFVQVFLSISFPITVGCALLISLYWHEMIHRTGKQTGMFLSKLKWFFLAFSVAIFVFEIATAYCRGAVYSFTILVDIDGAFYVITYLSVLAFFIITRLRLQKVFDELNKNLNLTGKAQKLSIATFHVQGMVVSLFLWVVMLVILALTSLQWTPTAFPICWFLNYTFLMTGALFQVLLIRAPYRPWKWIFCGLFMSKAAMLDLETESTVVTSGSLKSAHHSRSGVDTGSAHHSTTDHHGVHSATDSKSPV